MKKVPLDTVQENIPAIEDAFAQLIGTNVKNVNIRDIVKTPQGHVRVNVNSPKEIPFPENFTDDMENQLKSIPGFENVHIEFIIGRRVFFLFFLSNTSIIDFTSSSKFFLKKKMLKRTKKKNVER